MVLIIAGITGTTKIGMTGTNASGISGIHGNGTSVSGFPELPVLDSPENQYSDTGICGINIRICRYCLTGTAGITPPEQRYSKLRNGGLIWTGILRCKKRIAHSHNTRCDQVRADKLLRPLFYATYTDALACGNDAGKWLFKNRPFVVLKNGRDVDRFKFDEDKRHEMRVKQGISDGVIAVGHVGGFVPQKNHEFLLQIYKSLVVKNPNVKLFMIGDGVLHHEIETEAQQLGLMSNLTFTGNIDNVPDYLNAMDVMVFPSLFEGLPLAAIEWQINGLPIVMADTITSECIFASNVKQLSLEEDPGKWANTILEMVKINNRKQQSDIGIRAISKSGYNIKDSAKQLKELYLA